MKNVIEYKVVVCEPDQDFESWEEEINLCIYKGWQPLGAPSTIGQLFIQAMVMYEDQSSELEQLRERLQIDPGGSDKIDELEQSQQFLRHRLEMLETELETFLWDRKGRKGYSPIGTPHENAAIGLSHLQPDKKKA